MITTTTFHSSSLAAIIRSLAVVAVVLNCKVTTVFSLTLSGPTNIVTTSSSFPYHILTPLCVRGFAGDDSAVIGDSSAKVFEENVGEDRGRSDDSSERKILGKPNHNTNKKKEKKKIRPLEQNWWPVALTCAIDKNRPNSIELLGRKFVLWFSDDGDGNEQWSCLDDYCAHRFAPLSEGRVMVSTIEGSNNGSSNDEISEKKHKKKKNCLQCAYHGWEYGVDGSCTRIPQQTTKNNKQRKTDYEEEEDHSHNKVGTTTRNNPKNNWNRPTAKVRNYPVAELVGMIWIWADSSKSTLPLAKSELTKIPISPLLQRYAKVNPGQGFMRDLPYGYELLGENLLDLSHLPYSHHGMGNLHRGLGGPVPFRSLSEKERLNFYTKEQMDAVDSYKNMGRPATFQYEVQDALSHDPFFKGRQGSGGGNNGEALDAKCTCGFYDPTHIRYHRTSNPGFKFNTEVFLCPTSPGKSRVFLFHVVDASLPPLPLTDDVKVPEKENRQLHSIVPQVKVSLAISGFKAFLSKYSPMAIAKRIIRRSSNHNFHRWKSHMQLHEIFDGDGIFLHKQGDRMIRNELSYRDYYTPTTSDVLVNNFRRWIDSAAEASSSLSSNDCVAGRLAALTATGGMIGADAGASVRASTINRNNPSINKAYNDNIPRSEMLDRYESHTTSCATCSMALKHFQRQKSIVDIAYNALVGACGASGLSFLLGLGCWIISRGIQETVLQQTLPRISAVFLVPSVIGAVLMKRKSHELSGRIRQFYFMDYVHQEKH